MATLIDRARLDITTQIPTQLPTAVSRPLYAGVGATDRVVEVVREATDAVTARVDAWGRKDPRARRALASTASRGISRIVELALARTAPAGSSSRPSAKQVVRPRRSIQPSAVTRPGRAGAK